LTYQFEKNGGFNLRVSITGRCNLKCIYCVPPSSEYSGQKFYNPDLSLLFEACKIVSEAFKVTKIRITGGEPLVRSGMEDFCSKIRTISSVNHVGITTNGQLLAGKVKRLMDCGAGGVNVSLDSLNPDKFALITGGGKLEKTLGGINEAKQYGMKVKVNFVVMGGINDDEIEKMVNFGLDKKIEVRFLELMPFEGSSKIWKQTFIPAKEIIERIKKSFSLDPIETRPEQTARMFSVRTKRGEGIIGIIGSYDGNMCRSCNRLRITSEGKFRRCLKDPGELDLFQMIQKNIPKEEIFEEMKKYVRMKKNQAPLLGSGNMCRIGG